MIRKYQPEDREEWRYLWMELTEWHREIYQDPTIGGMHPEDYFDRHLADVGPDRLWVAVSGSHVVGLIGLIVRGNEAEIEPLVVSKAHRGKGIGKELIEVVVSEARSEGVRFLYKRGFKNLGHIELFLDFSDYAWKSRLEIHGYEFGF